MIHTSSINSVVSVCTAAEQHCKHGGQCTVPAKTCTLTWQLDTWLTAFCGFNSKPRY